MKKTDLLNCKNFIFEDYSTIKLVDLIFITNGKKIPADYWPEQFAYNYALAVSLNINLRNHFANNLDANLDNMLIDIFNKYCSIKEEGYKCRVVGKLPKSIEEKLDTLLKNCKQRALQYSAEWLAKNQNKTKEELLQLEKEFDKKL